MHNLPANPTPMTRPVSLVDAYPVLVGIVAFVSLAGPLLILAGYDLASLFVDDAFYCFQIAKNLAQGLGPTFDGLHETNGFHPLWMLVLVPIFGVVPGLDAPVRVAGLVEAGLVACGAALLYRGLAERGSRREALLAALFSFATPGTRGVLRTGLEGALVFLLLVLAWRAWLRWKEGAASALLQLGAWLALLALARIEGVLMLLAVAFWERQVLRRDRRAFVTLLLPTCLVMGAYIAFNLLRFGIPLPVSGLVKQAAHARRGMWHLAGLTLPKSLSILLPAAAALCALAWLVCSRAPELAARLGRSGAAWLLLGAAAMFGADLLTLGGLQHWYAVPALPALALAAAGATSSWRRPVGLAIVLLACAAIARVPHTLWIVQHQRLHGHIRGEAADALRDVTPASARIGAWNGGMLGYYSERHVVMLDGLANDATYYRRVVQRGELERYLLDEQITSLAVTGCKLVWVARELGPELAQRIAGRVHERSVLARDPTTDPCGAYSLWALAQ